MNFKNVRAVFFATVLLTIMSPAYASQEDNPYSNTFRKTLLAKATELNTSKEQSDKDLLMVVEAASAGKQRRHYDQAITNKNQLEAKINQQHISLINFLTLQEKTFTKAKHDGSKDSLEKDKKYSFTMAELSNPTADKLAELAIKWGFTPDEFKDITPEELAELGNDILQEKNDLMQQVAGLERHSKLIDSICGEIIKDMEKKRAIAHQAWVQKVQGFFDIKS